MIHARRYYFGASTTALALGLALCFSTVGASADTLTGALSRTYSTNPAINAERARLRAIDEGVPQALSGYRPRVTGNADISYQHTTRRGSGGSQTESGFPRGFGVGVQQNIFRGFRTQNEVKQAEANVLAGRETLRDTEQDILLSAVQAYMNVVRDTAILEVRRGNVIFLEETLRATRDRFNVGEVTRTDVAQAEASLQRGRSNLSVAEATLSASRASYRQIVGVEARNLAPGVSVERALPRSVDAAIALARREHPVITTASYTVDVAQYAVKIVEGERLPTVTLEGSLEHRYDTGNDIDSQTTATIIGQVNVPFYQGGQVSSRVRQAKETLGQRKIELDLAREQVQAEVVTAWGDLLAAQAQVVASQAEVEANEIALRGVQEEARVGQRTTLDVLDAQQDLLSSRERLITAQRDRIVASYAVMSSLGQLNPTRLRLPVREYEPGHHYREVRDLWWGSRTPSGQ